MATAGPTDAHQRVREQHELLLARIGLPADATTLDVEAARDRVVTYLTDAPAVLREWADYEIAVIGRVCEVLLAPTAQDDGAVPVPSPSSEQAPSPDVAPDSATREPASADPDHTAAGATAVSAGGTATAAGVTGAAGSKAPTDGRKGVRFWVTIATGVALLAAAVIAFAVWNRGPAVPGISGTPTNVSGSPTGPVLDQAKVAAQMTKLAADPKDTVALMALGDLYFQAGDYKSAAAWQEKVIALDPRNVKAIVALGASKFNAGDTAGAKAQWTQAVAIDPGSAEAHYDLGFLYLNQNPPDVARVRAEWQKVVQIDPSSDLAKTVATHLDTLGGPSSSNPASNAPAPSPSTS